MDERCDNGKRHNEIQFRVYSTIKHICGRSYVEIDYFPEREGDIDGKGIMETVVNISKELW